LDRDGTINNLADSKKKVTRLRVFSGVARAIKKLNELGFLVVVITNQGGIGKEVWKKKEVDQVHALLVSDMKKQGAVIDAVYYCPHHPKATLEKYRLECECRKPNIGLILKAIKRFKINPKESFLVGDMTRDILAGKRAGMKTILVKTGQGGKEVRYRVKVNPDFVARDINAAAKIIKQITSMKA